MSSDKLIHRTVYLLKRTDKKYDGTDIYVGSTSLPLPQRLSRHRHHSKVCGGKLYRRMGEIGPQKWEIVPLAVIPKCTRTEILNFEKMWIGFLNSDLNMLSPSDVDNKWGNAGRRNYERQHYLNIIKDKKYFCGVCNHAFGKLSDLNRHLKSLKHSKAYINSVD